MLNETQSRMSGVVRDNAIQTTEKKQINTKCLFKRRQPTSSSYASLISFKLFYMQVHIIPVTPAVNIEQKATMQIVAPGPAHISHLSPLFESSVKPSLSQSPLYFTFELEYHQAENATMLRIMKSQTQPIINVFLPGSLSSIILTQHNMYLVRKINDTRQQM